MVIKQNVGMTPSLVPGKPPFLAVLLNSVKDQASYQTVVFSCSFPLVRLVDLTLVSTSSGNCGKIFVD